MSALNEIEAIKRLKYKYFRCIDTKRWKELAECFSEDARCDYDSGKYAHEGRDAILAFLEGAMGRPAMITLHQVHHPEIELTGPGEATGVWYLEDRVVDREHDFVLQGAAFYRDTYRKEPEGWRIRSTGYERVFEEMGRASALPLAITRTLFDGTPGEGGAG